MKNVIVVVMDSKGNVKKVDYLAKLSVTSGVKLGKLVEFNRTFNRKPPSAFNPIIPKGFAPINVGEAIWGRKNAWKYGLVVVDASGNEYVWAPVPKFSKFKRNDKYYNGYGLKAERCGELTGNGITGDSEAHYMYSSVNQYYGFYFGRYEAGKPFANPAIDGTVKPLSQKGAAVWNNIPWGKRNSDNYPGKGAVTVARAAYPKEDKNLAVVSTLIYGVQWDAVLRYIEISGGKTREQIKDSSSWGNYFDNVDRRSVIPNNPAVTGALERWSTNNIHDLAGNVYEMTMEVYLNKRVNRSGSHFLLSGGDRSASYRGCDSFGNTGTSLGFRVALYIK